MLLLFFLILIGCKEESKHTAEFDILAFKKRQEIDKQDFIKQNKLNLFEEKFKIIEDSSMSLIDAGTSR